MASVITEADIRKFQGMSQAILPAGVILTPAAKDWAQERHLSIIFGEESNPGSASQCVNPNSGNPASVGLASDGRKVLLHQVIKAVVKKVNQNGTPLSQEDLVSIIIACLERLGCQVK